MIRILVTGGTGQLAQSLHAARPNATTIIGRPEFDFERPETLATAIQHHHPALVVNAAAYTAVDLAESEPDQAARANTTGPAILAEACAAARIPFIHISTDYVFDGERGAPYLETDPTGPTGVYGATKLAGEDAVMAANPAAIILRTSWVYARTGKNFVLTMLRAAKRASQLRVVGDQVGCPTNAADLAQAVLAVADRLLANSEDQELGGIYHAAGQGSTTWHGFAEAIFEAARPTGWPQPNVTSITTADWPTPARRPADSRLDCGKLAQTFGVRLPHWRTSLATAVADICAAEAALLPAVG